MAEAHQAEAPRVGRGLVDGRRGRGVVVAGRGPRNGGGGRAAAILRDGDAGSVLMVGGRVAVGALPEAAGVQRAAALEVSVAAVGAEGPQRHCWSGSQLINAGSRPRRGTWHSVGRESKAGGAARSDEEFGTQGRHGTGRHRTGGAGIDDTGQVDAGSVQRKGTSARPRPSCLRAAAHGCSLCSVESWPATLLLQPHQPHARHSTAPYLHQAPARRHLPRHPHIPDVPRHPTASLSMPPPCARRPPPS